MTDTCVSRKLQHVVLMKNIAHQAIAFARIPKEAADSCQVDIRGRLLDCRIVRPPFARNGSVCEGII